MKEREALHLQEFFSSGPPLPTQDRRLTVTYLSTSEHDLLRLEPLVGSLTSLMQKSESDPEAYEAARRLLDFVKSLQDLTDRALSFEQQTNLLHDIKTWIPFMPKAVLSLSKRNAFTMVVMAHFSAVAIAAVPYVPDVAAALFLFKRTEVIGNIWSALLQLEQEQVTGSPQAAELADAVDMAVVPLVYAVRYRTQQSAEGSAATST